MGAMRCTHWQEIFGDKNRGLPMLQRGCAAGVRYGELAQALSPTEPHWNSRLPCWGKTTEQGARPCARYAPVSAELQAAAEAKLRTILSVIPDLVAQIEATLTEPGVAEGKVDCPVCGTGKIGWVYEVRRRGHTSQGVCSTQDCVRWMT